MIKSVSYKDRPALKVSSGRLTATVLPEDGGKIASLVTCDGRELLTQRPGETYKRLSLTAPYIDAECSGFDDMFPTCDPWGPETGPSAGVVAPDHGETCRLSYRAEAAPDVLRLTADSVLFPVSYEKTFTASGRGISVAYSFKNRGNEPFPFLWAGHCMLAGEDGMRLFHPYPEGTPVEEMFCTPGYDFGTLPRDRMSGYRPGTGAAYKYYFLDPMPDGLFGVRYPDGTFSFRVEKEKVPYLGIWINNGEFQSLYNLAIEAATVPLDAPDRAAAAGYRGEIPPGGNFTFTLILDWTAEKRI